MLYKKLVLALLVLIMGLTGCMSSKSEMQEKEEGKKRNAVYAGSYSVVYFRGTPNSWGKTEMKLVADYTWQTVQVFGATSTERFKIDVSGNWTTAYPSSDYMITGGAGAYTITFNDKTKSITAVKGVLESLTINSVSGTINKGETFVLPATGTLTKEGTTSSVNLTWSPALDVNTVGTKVYTGKATETTQTVSFTLTVKDPNVKKTLYSNGVWLRGTSNSWGKTEMELTADYTRTVKATFGTASEERFKIDVSGNWTEAYPAKDYMITNGAGTYTITFNEETKTVTAVKGDSESLTISSISGTINKGETFVLPATGTLTKEGTTSSVNLTWSPALDVNTVGTKVYTGTALGTTQTVSFTLTVKDPNVKKTLYSNGVWLRGTSNSWGKTEMELTADYTRTIKATFGNTTTERFKIDVSGNWTTSYPTADYLITEGAGTYTVTFNEQTKAITAVKTGSESLTISTTSSTINKGDAFALPTTGTYKKADGTTSSVNLIWSPALDVNTAGTKVYTGTASGTTQTVSFTLTVTDPNVKKTLYSKGVWLRGTSNSWGKTEMELTADYTRTVKTTFGSASTERFKIDVSGDWTTSYPTADYAITNGTGTYTITFNEQTKTITAVKEIAGIVSIELTSPPNKNLYFVGSKEISLTGIEVIAAYSNGTKSKIDVTTSNITGFNTETAGVKVITVTVGGKTATFNITVKEHTLAGETYIAKKPIKNIYYLGETKLDLTGMSVTRYYSDENGMTIDVKSDVTITDKDVTGFTTLKTGVVTITVTYDGVGGTFNIIVLPESNKTNRMLYVPADNTTYLGVSDTTPLKDLYVGRYEVTQAEYLNVMGENPSYFTGNLNLPVENLTFYKAAAYCNALSRKEGLKPYYKDNLTDSDMKKGPEFYILGGNGYRMPSYKERYYFATDCGRRATTYPGSEDVDEVAWSSRNSGNKTHEVGLKKPNNLGLYDIGGNVMEMTNEIYVGDWSSGITYATCGGDYRSSYILCDARNVWWKTFAVYADYQWVGFRVVRTAE